MVEEKNIPVSVYAESTPNPKTMKFVANIGLISNGATVEYTSIEETTKAPFAARLFSFPFVTGVFISGNFVTISKNDSIEWQEVFAELREYITNYLATGHPIFDEVIEEKNTDISAEPSEETIEHLEHVEPTNDLEKKIVELLEEYVRPGVESDGGAIHFRKFEGGVLSVVLKGACSGCPSSTVTLKNGIQTLFTQMLPEVKEVVAIEG